MFFLRVYEGWELAFPIYCPWHLGLRGLWFKELEGLERLRIPIGWVLVTRVGLKYVGALPEPEDARMLPNSIKP